MSGENRFQTLKAGGLATKEYKFRQGRSLALLDPAKAANANAINQVQLTPKEYEGAKHGICAALAADWLREKLASESVLFAGAFQGAGVHSGQNLDTVVRNVPKQLAYQRSPSAVEALNQHGLAPKVREVGDPVIKQRVTTVEKGRSSDRSMYSKKSFENKAKFAESLANACTAGFLKEGRGVYISFSVKAKDPTKSGGGHAVAAYRSRGNTLYFFDPNCGVYNINNPDGFFAAYETCYDALGYTCELDPVVRNNGFTYVQR